MAIKRMDNVSIVVEDLDAAIAFFTELGMSVLGRTEIEGDFADRTVGIDGIRSEIAMLGTPDGHSRLEVTTYHHPALIPGVIPPNAVGFHRVMFAVDDLRGTIERLKPLGGEVVKDVVNYENVYLLCYLRGPSGIVIGLAEELG